MIKRAPPREAGIGIAEPIQAQRDIVRLDQLYFSSVGFAFAQFFLPLYSETALGGLDVV
jgi:hypothetical protein